MSRNDPPSVTDRATQQLSLSRALVRNAAAELHREGLPDPESLAVLGGTAAVVITELVDVLDAAGECTRRLDSSPRTDIVHALANQYVNGARRRLQDAEGLTADYTRRMNEFARTRDTPPEPSAQRPIVMSPDGEQPLPPHLRQARPPVMQRVVLVVLDFARSLPADGRTHVVQDAWNLQVLQHELWARGLHIVYEQEAAWHVSRCGWPVVRLWMDVYGGTARVQGVLARAATPVPTDRHWQALPEVPETLRRDGHDERELADLVDQAFSEHLPSAAAGPVRLVER